MMVHAPGYEASYIQLHIPIVRSDLINLAGWKPFTKEEKRINSLLFFCKRLLLNLLGLARSLAILPDRLMAGHLVLVQAIMVRIPVREPKKNTHLYGVYFSLVPTPAPPEYKLDGTYVYHLVYRTGI
jgi:hypothetical protein